MAVGLALAAVGLLVLLGFTWQACTAARRRLATRRAVRQLTARERDTYEAAQRYAEQAGDGLWLDPVDEHAAAAIALTTPRACTCAICRLPDSDVRRAYRTIVAAYRRRPPISPGRG